MSNFYNLKNCPIRPVDPLKRILKEFDNVTFVSNEETFKQALKQSKFEDYFIDSFGGNFGHCTPKGNQLLANQVADEILRLDRLNVHSL